MSRKAKIIISVSVAVILLTMGGTAAVMAHEKPAKMPEASATGPLALETSTTNVTSNITGMNALLARVAAILGIPQDKLESAFKQARQEMRTEAYFKALDKAVEKGRITKDEADKIKNWWNQRPEGLDRLIPRGLGIPALSGGHMMPRGWHRPALSRS